MDKSGYENLWHEMAIPAEHLHTVEQAAEQILEGHARYSNVGGVLGIAWWWIGAIHMREASCSFAHHLHNGDPLTARTVHVPPGRPEKGEPPFTWEQSAMDAMMMRRLDHVMDWSIGSALAQAEAYNGMGYANRGVRSPYVWSLTTLQQPGKYVADGIWNAAFMDQQPGVAALISVLQGFGVSLS